MGNSRHLGSGTLKVIMEMFTKMNNFRVKVIAHALVDGCGFEADTQENKCQP